MEAPLPSSGGITSKESADAMIAVARRHMESGDGTAAAKLALEVYKQTRSVEAQELLEELFHGSAPEVQAASALEKEADSWLWFMIQAGGGVALAAGAFSICVPPSVSVGLTPLLGFGSYASTLWICCGIHREHERYQPGVFIPVISELGITQPGTIVYQLGFTMVGVFLALSMFRIEDLVGPLLVPAAQAAGPVPGSREPLPDFHTAILCGYGSAFGAALQGIFTLDMTPSLKVLLHFAGAMCFMAGAMQHAQAVDVLYTQAAVTAEQAAKPADTTTNAAAAAAASAGVMAERFLDVGYVRLAHSFRHIAINGGLPVVGFVLPLGFQLYQSVTGTGLGAKPPKDDDNGAKKKEEGGKRSDAAESAATTDRTTEGEGEREGEGGQNGGAAAAAAAPTTTTATGAAKKVGGEAAAPTDNGMEPGMANMMGMIQWLIIFLFAAYYATYCADLHAACVLTPSCANQPGRGSRDFVDQLRKRGVLPQI